MDYLEAVDLSDPDVAEFFDELPLWSAPFGLLLLDHVPMKPATAILDIGAGTGWLTIEMAERCGPEARVVAVDTWKGASDRLRRKIAHRGLRQIEVMEQDAAALDLPPSSFDVIVSNLGINNFSDPDAVLAACARVAKPGASLLVTTNLTGHMKEFYQVFRATLEQLGQDVCLPLLDEHERHRGTADSVALRVRGAGFAITDEVTGSFRMRFANGSALLSHYFIRLGFVQGWKSVLPADSTAEVFGALERNLNREAEAAGELSLTVPMLCLVATRR